MTLSLHEYLTVDGVAELAQCSVAAVRYRILHGQLVPTETVRNTTGRPILLLFSEEDARRHFQERPLKTIGLRRSDA